MKKILITGGAGFIGSHLCNYLVNKNNKIICLDDLSSSSKNNITLLLKNNNFKFILHDIRMPYKCNVDEIYHLACPASPVQYQKNPIKTIETSVLGAINMLNLAKECNAKICFSSTSEIYGDPSIHPQNENYWGNVNPIGKRSCYDEGKRCAETLFFEYYRKHNIKIKIARIFNTYGPNMHPKDGRVISNFIIQALKKKYITIYGTGKQSRSFCFITDLIKGLTKLMSSSDMFTGPVNIGNTNEITINQLAELIIQLTNSKSTIKYHKLPDNDPIRRRPDIALAINELNWQPKIELNKGLQMTINYFNKILK